MSHDNDATRGMTLRELMLEVREEVKLLNKTISDKPDRKEIYGVMGLVVTVSLGLAGLLF